MSLGAMMIDLLRREDLHNDRTSQDNPQFTSTFSPPPNAT
jgi:hypothetical protein